MEQKQMNARTLGFLAVALAVGLANIAPAQVITINPNNFGSGQVINAPGVALETETFVQAGTDSSGNPQYVPTFFGPVYSDNIAASCSAAGGTQCPAVGTNLFAPSPTGALPGTENFGPGGFWGNQYNDVPAMNCSQNCLLGAAAQGSIILRLSFALPVDFVDALAFSNGGDPTEITAFDSAGNIVSQAFNGQNFGSGFGWDNATVTTTTNDISTVLIGGFDSYRGVNEIQYRSAPVQAPEIDTNSAASGLSLLLGALLILRGRRQAA
jgi:hypothetical protein